MANHLAHETSPYLLQHADNPVDWYPWGEEALDKARAEDKPIFLSIGYSACHWCHVMAHESFEDDGIAEILNRHFVSIKVDREERPDLDRIYMTAVQAMTGSGGWPMSVFATPDGRPFYGGTYFPPAPRHGMPGFPDVLLAIGKAWRERRQELIAGSEQVVSAIEGQGLLEGTPAVGGLSADALTAAFEKLAAQFDQRQGGWGKGPKFPQPMALEFLLRYHYSTGAPRALEMATQTLEAMARGGVYDQVGGGFHRYAVDGKWLVPHFEKMLYDNAQLARVYVHAWQITGNAFFATIAQETLDYVLREMTAPGGGFYSTQDADSEGQEGKFFVWSADEIREVLGNGADAFMAAYGVTPGGNFEGKNVLEFVGDLGERPGFADARRKLFAVRERRVHPGRDEKVLSSWNGLMLAAFAEAGRALKNERYVQAAVDNATFLLAHLCQENGRLYHTWKAGQAKIDGYLEDYAYLIDGLLALYQVHFDPRWYEAARELADLVIDHFAAEVGFYDTSDDGEALITRPRELQDNATPSGNAMAVWDLLQLGGLSLNEPDRERARAVLRHVQPVAVAHPLAFGQWLTALDYAVSRTYEIAIAGNLEAAETQALIAACQSTYRPHHVMAVASPNEAPVPLLAGRGQVDGRPAAHVCVSSGVQNLCLPPVTDPADLQPMLDKR